MALFMWWHASVSVSAVALFGRKTHGPTDPQLAVGSSLLALLSWPPEAIQRDAGSGGMENKMPVAGHRMG